MTTATAPASEINLAKLKEPFMPADIEWRVGRSGLKDGKPWAQVLAYVTARAVQDRLDEVCGPGNWRNEYKAGPLGGVLCGISICINSEWITKWDGADNTDIESVKGGLSDSMKRAAVVWGIGRYLYNLDVGWADVCDNGTHRDSIKAKEKGGKDTWFKWNPPQLPKWAMPAGAGGTSNGASPRSASEPQQPANVQRSAEDGGKKADNGKQHGQSSGAGNGAGKATGNGKDPFKDWEAKIVSSNAPAQLRAMKNGIGKSTVLSDEQKAHLQDMAERFAVRIEGAVASAGAPGE